MVLSVKKNMMEGSPFCVHNFMLIIFKFCSILFIFTILLHRSLEQDLSLLLVHFPSSSRICITYKVEDKSCLIRPVPFTSSGFEAICKTTDHMVFKIGFCEQMKYGKYLKVYRTIRLILIQWQVCN